MSRLMRSSEVSQRPVVTIAGDDVAQVKDIVYAADGGSVLGFTLAGRGLFSGPLREVLPWSNVAALGSDALIVKDEDALTDPAALESDSGGSVGKGGNILGSRVLTDTGTDLGVVVDAIVEVAGGHEQCDVVGYEIESSEALENAGTKVLIPLPDTMAASGEHLIVPASARNFVRKDLAGFGAAVDEFREQLQGRSN